MARQPRYIIRNWLIATLVGMSFMRLVWIQIRDFDMILDDSSAEALGAFLSRHEQTCPEDIASKVAQPQISMIGSSAGDERYSVPGLLGYFWLRCRIGPVDSGFLLKTNLTLFVLTVLIVSVSARMLTSSWLIGFGVSALLLSRGSMISGISFFTPDFFVMLGVSLAIGAWIHFLITAFTPSFFLMMLAIGISATFDVRMLSAFVVPGLFLVVVSVIYLVRVRSGNLQDRRPASAFRRVQDSSLTGFTKELSMRGSIIAVASAFAFLGCLALLLESAFGSAFDWNWMAHSSTVRELVKLSARTFDLHYLFSLIAIAIIFILRLIWVRMEQTGALAFVSVFLFICVMMLGMRLESLNLQQLEASPILIWFEPSVLALPISILAEWITARLRL